MGRAFGLEGQAETIVQVLLCVHSRAFPKLEKLQRGVGRDARCISSRCRQAGHPNRNRIARACTRSRPCDFAMYRRLAAQAPGYPGTGRSLLDVLGQDLRVISAVRHSFVAIAGLASQSRARFAVMRSRLSRLRVLGLPASWSARGSATDE